MERVPSNYLVDQSRVDQQFHYSSVAPGSENVQFASPVFIQDPFNSVNRGAGLHNLDMSAASPVLNYSIQTGEEFAFDFMRDRLNQESPFIPHTLNNPSYSTGYMELKSILGISHMGSESGSELSVLANIERGPREFERNNSALLEDRSNYGITLSGPPASSTFDSTQGIAYCHESLRTSNNSTKIKVLCSFGGKIFPRPSDRKLRYVGGETHIMGIRRDITWQELMQKALTIYSQVKAIKYQLPGEELDSLVSVSSDEDLQNMIEEYKEPEYQEGSQRLRMFLLSKKDLDDSQFCLGYVDDNSEFQYVIAVNGMDMAAAENPTLHDVGHSSATNLHELDMNGNRPETSKLFVETMAVSTSPIVPSSTVSHTEPAQATSSACQLTYQPLFSGNNVYQKETEQYHLHYGQIPYYAPYLENPTSMPLHGFGNQPGGMSGGQLQDGLQVLDPEMSAKQVISKDEGSLELDTGPKNVFPKVMDYSNSAQTYNNNVARYHPAKEASAAVAVPDGDPSQFSLKKEGKPLETENIPSSVGVGYPVHVPEIIDHNNGRISSSKLAHGYTNPGNDPSDLCYSKTSAPPQRYQSERFPQKQAELLTRFSKSDDSLGSQLLAAHLHSEPPQQDSDIKSYQSQGMNLVASQSGEMMSSEKLCTDLQPVGDGPVQVQNYRECESSQQIVLEEGVKEAMSIDIDDRFPRDYLYDMFSKAISENFCSNVPHPNDESGLNLNLEDHESRQWSDFQKSAQSEYVDNDVSVIDQDPIGFQSSSRTADERNNVLYHSKPLATDEVPTDNVSFPVHRAEDNQKDLPVFTGAGSQVTPSHYDNQTEISESMQFEAMIKNMRTPESEYKDGKVAKKSVGLPPLSPSLGDVDVSTLQFIKNDDLEELKELGSGSFGTVYYGKWRGTDVAIKRIKKSCFTGRSSEQERLAIEFWREADILSKLHHPNVVAFYGVVRDGPGATLATITEFMVDGSLRHALLRKDRYLDRLNRLIIAMDAAFGMEYLHSKNIVHFDLKCDNLLVNLTDPARPICKVGDFGLSKIKRNTLVSGGVRGTLPWMAPELLNGNSIKVSEKVDVFSFGVVLWEILTGEEPYAKMHYGAIIGGIVNNTLRPAIPNYCDPEWRQLMEQCWTASPMARPSFTEIASRLRSMVSAASQAKAQGQKASN